MNKQRGFTLIELISWIVFLLMVSAIGGGAYILGHFVVKFW